MSLLALKWASPKVFLGICRMNRYAFYAKKPTQITLNWLYSIGSEYPSVGCSSAEPTSVYTEYSNLHYFYPLITCIVFSGRVNCDIIGKKNTTDPLRNTAYELYLAPFYCIFCNDYFTVFQV
jgi:hypothetical protein